MKSLFGLCISVYSFGISPTKRLSILLEYVPKLYRSFAFVMRRRFFARVIATYQSLLSSSSSSDSKSVRECGKIPSSAPAMITCSNSSHFALCMVMRTTFCASVTFSCSAVIRAISSRKCMSDSLGSRSS